MRLFALRCSRRASTSLVVSWIKGLLGMTFGRQRWSQCSTTRGLTSLRAVDALVLSRFDANSTPLDHRPAELLWRKYFESSAFFTRVYDNWSVSGQNDAEKFTEFVTGSSNGSSTYPYVLMCDITLFYALKCGRPDNDDEVLRWYVKTAPAGVMYDDEIDDDEDQNSEKDQEPARSTAKRQCRAGSDSTNEHTHTFAAIAAAVEQVGKCMSRIFSLEEAAALAISSARGVKEVVDAARERSMFTLQDRKTVLLDLQMISSEIRKAQSENEEDEVIAALKEHRDALIQTFKDLRDNI
jgi:hypothetical protein